MKVEVQPIYEKGRSARAKERVAMPKYRGTLRVREERVHELGRITTVAALLSEVDGTDTPVLPELHDACLLHVDGAKLRIRGFERVGEANYGQTWDVKAV